MKYGSKNFFHLFWMLISIGWNFRNANLSLKGMALNLKSFWNILLLDLYKFCQYTLLYECFLDAAVVFMWCCRLNPMCCVCKANTCFATRLQPRLCCFQNLNWLLILFSLVFANLIISGIILIYYKYFSLEWWNVSGSSKIVSLGMGRSQLHKVLF